VREVEALYVDAIAAARRWIYVENQYLTSDRAVECLAARLREPAGPELVLVLPARCPAWLEEVSMGRLRARSLARLRAADRYGRLRLYSPRTGPDTWVNVHAKVLVVDDALVRVGSSNLTNRSLELDTECDLSVEAGERADVAGAIARFRNDLIAEHLGASEGDVRARLRSEGSLIGAIESLRRGTRTLEPLACAEAPGRVGAALASAFDPRGRSARCGTNAPPSEEMRPGRLPLVVASLLVALVLALLLFPLD
jgi:phosphatidylserine/phosphatidylglycerophosphate/cardiolipin synthase-like enzyme